MLHAANLTRHIFLFSSPVSSSVCPSLQRSKQTNVWLALLFWQQLIVAHYPGVGNTVFVQSSPTSPLAGLASVCRVHMPITYGCKVRNKHQPLENQCFEYQHNFQEKTT